MDAEGNARAAEIAHHLRNAYNSSAWLFAEKELVERMPTAKLEITERNVLVPLTSWEKQGQGATPNVLDTMIALPIWPAFDSSVRILVVNLIPMFVAKVLIARSGITSLFARVLEASLGIHTFPAESSLNRIFAIPILADLEPRANLVRTGLEVTDQFVLVPMDTVETL